MARTETWFYCSVDGCRRYHKHFKTKEGLEHHALTVHNCEVLLEGDWRTEIVDVDAGADADAAGSGGGWGRGDADAASSGRAGGWSRGGQWAVETLLQLAVGGQEDGHHGRGDADARGRAHGRLRSRSRRRPSLTQLTDAELIAELSRRLASSHR